MIILVFFFFYISLIDFHERRNRIRFNVHLDLDINEIHTRVVRVTFLMVGFTVILHICSATGF